MIQIKAVVKEASLEGGRLGRMISPSVERVHLGAFSRDDPGSAGAGLRQFTRDLLQSIDLSIWFCLPL